MTDLRLKKEDVIGVTTTQQYDRLGFCVAWSFRPRENVTGATFKKYHSTYNHHARNPPYLYL